MCCSCWWVLRLPCWTKASPRWKFLTHGQSEHQVLSTSCFTTSCFLLPHTTRWSTHSHRQLAVNQLRLVNKTNVTVGQCVVCEASKAILSNWWDPSKSTAFSFSTMLLITSRSSLAQEDQTKGRRKITTLWSMRCREGSRVVLSREEWGEMVTAFVSNIGCCKEERDKSTPLSTVEEAI